jgi:hypothetical protein
MAQERLAAALRIFGRLGARKEIERTEQLPATLGEQEQIPPCQTHRVVLLV